MMFKNLTLTRPLCFLDLETTGLDVFASRIVELSILWIYPDTTRPIVDTIRLNPGIPIPAAASAVHGITDAMVSGSPSFAAIAPDMAAMLAGPGGCDLSGYGVRRFDLPLLAAEFRRAGLAFSLDGRHVLDVMELYHSVVPFSKTNRRTLARAVRDYLGRDHTGAHSSAADVLASAEVLDAIIGEYRFPQTIEGILAMDRLIQY